MDAWVAMLSAFEAEGLPEPPVPVSMRPAVREWHEWCWSTRSMDGTEMYLFRPPPFEEVLTQPVDDYVAVSHAGHGVNSYAITYHLVYRALAIYIQIGWGGLYTDAALSAGRLRELFCHVRRLIELTEKRADPPNSPWRLICNVNSLRGMPLAVWAQVPEPTLHRYAFVRENRLDLLTDPLAVAAHLLRTGPPTGEFG